MAKRESASQVGPSAAEIALVAPPTETAPAAPRPPAQTRARAQDTTKPESAPLVVKWDNGSPARIPKAAAEPSEAAPEEGAPAEGEQSPADEAPKTDASQEGDAAAGEDGAEVAAEGAESGEQPKAEPEKPSRARGILKRLAAERAKLEAEGVATAERQRREAAEAALQKYTQGSLGARLAALGITTEAQRQELAEAILLGKDVVLPDAPAPEPSADERVKALERKLQEKEQAELQAQHTQAYSAGHQAVLTITKDMDLSVPRAVEKIVGPKHADGSPSGTHLIVAVAQQMWEAAGRPANSAPIVREAANRVVAHYRAQYPEVFQQQAAGVTQQLAAKRPSMGQRVPPKPGATGAKLPRDKQDRDELIKREMGWT